MSNAAANNRSAIDPTSFAYTKVDITTSTGITFDISDFVAELEISESVYMFSLVFTISIVDSADLFNKLRISGNEKFHIELYKITPEGKVAYEYDCYASGIPGYAKTGHNTQVYKISCISKHGFIGAIQRVSKPFVGSFVKCVKDLIEGDLESEVSHYDNNSAGAVRGIYPDLVVNDAIGMLLSRASDEHGAPFYAFETALDGIHVESHTRIIKNHIYEEEFKDAFFFKEETPTEANPDDPNFKRWYKNKQHRILSIESNLGMSKLNGMQSGAIASRTLEVNSANKSFANYDYHYQTNDVSINEESLYDNTFKLKNKELCLYKDVVSHTVHSNSNLYENSKSFNQAIAPVMGKKESVKANLGNMSHVIRICGNVDVHSGSIISLKLPKTIDPNLESKVDDGYTDEFMSGKYFVVSVIHTFGKDGHYTMLKLKRDTVPVSIREGIKE